MSGLPDGRAVRRWTRAVTRHHAEVGMTDLLGDVYTAAFAVVLSASMVVSVSSRLAPAGGIGAVAGTSSRGALDARWLAVLAAVAAVAGVVGLAVRLGPVGLGAAGATWWLPLPVERRGLLRAAAYRWPAVAVVAGAIAGTAAAVACRAVPGSVVLAGLLTGSVALALVAVAGLAQTRASAHALVRRAADALLLTTPVAGVVLGLVAWVPSVGAGGLAVGAAAGVTAAGALLVGWDRRIATVPGASVRSRGAAADEAMVAVLSLDSRGLGRALVAVSEPASRRRSRRFALLARVPRGLRAQAVLVAADVTLLLRTRRHVAQWALSATLPVLALASAGTSRVAVGAALLVGAFLASSAAAEGARRAQVNPTLDGVLPLSGRQVREARLVTPAAALLVWWLVVGTVLGVSISGIGAGGVALGVLSAPAWAAAALRAAYRPLPDLNRPMVATPMGAVPTGLFSGAARGPDLALVASVPMLVALAIGGVPEVLLLAQVALSGLLVALSGVKLVP